MASSSASHVSKKYDVFLSFRGTDTRHSIVSFLYEALVSTGIVTFKDDKRFELGDHISDELHRAIEGSDFVVVLLSENHATSRWCLMELQLIMELHTVRRLGVIPVFYGVEPTVVRHQKGTFDLERYDRPEEADKVPKWREALKMISDLSGLESRLCIDEATMVRKIVKDISRRKAMMHKIDLRNIVGVDTHMEGLKSLLDMDSKNDEARMIGIWGMGGIGKTTIAKCLYGQLSSKFTTSHFTEDIKGIHRDLDLRNLQNKLLYNTVGDDNMPWSVEAGRQFIAAALGNHRVLLVLDGVDKMAQIHALAEESRWFGRGSRIIITTRDRGLLNSCGVNTIYEVNCLDDKDSLQMFKQIAFEGGNPPSVDFEQFSIRAAQLAHGLPSALQAYALFLRGRANSPEEWEEAVCGMESNPDENIMKILKMSYEGLRKSHKKAFLYVACLFNGDTYHRVASLLDGSKPERYLGIRVLAEKSLINITTNGYVILHKLVEQMGREIMLDGGEFIGDPENILDARYDGEGRGQTECISLHTCEMTRAFSVRTSVFNRMHKLKFLKVYKHVDNKESRLQVIPSGHEFNRLRLLHWDAFPLRTLPLLNEAYYLVELNLRHSNLETLWSGTLDFHKLKKLDVTGSKNLRQLPDLSCLQKLEELLLEQCIRLEGIPESLRVFRESPRERPTPRRLNLSYYGGPDIPMGVVIPDKFSMQHITLEFPTAKVVMELTNISIAGAIEFCLFLDCEGCAEYFSLQQIPVAISVRQAPRLISESIKFYTLNIRRFSYKENSPPARFSRLPAIPGLKELKLVNLNIQHLPDGIGYFSYLEKLDLSGNDFGNLPEDMNRLTRLKTLWLRNCSRLRGLPELIQVQSLTLSNCRNLRTLVNLYNSSQDPPSYCLIELCLDNCKNVESLSEQLSHFTTLTFLDLSSHDFKTLPSSIKDLTSLVTLSIYNCKKLVSVKELPLSLQFLDAHGCDSLEADALEHFKGRLNREVPAQPRSACFQETEMPNNYCFLGIIFRLFSACFQATESRLC